MVWPKLSVADYPEMLRKLSVEMFFLVIACIWILRSHIPEIEGVFKRFDVTPNVSVFQGVSVPFGTFIVALLLAGITEATKLHDKWSNALGIRSVFDVRWILVPLALESTSTLGPRGVEKIRINRKHLMAEVFYRYATSAKQSDIDPHLITQALTAWSWYWTCIEANTVLVPTALLFVWFGHWQLAAFLAALILGLLLAMKLFRAEAAKYADAEVREILSNQDRRLSIKTVFDAL